MKIKFNFEPVTWKLSPLGKIDTSQIERTYKPEIPFFFLSEEIRKTKEMLKD
jgi:hypothetical protein